MWLMLLFWVMIKFQLPQKILGQCFSKVVLLWTWIPVILKHKLVRIIRNRCSLIFNKKTLTCNGFSVLYFSWFFFFRICWILYHAVRIEFPTMIYLLMQTLLGLCWIHASSFHLFLAFCCKDPLMPVYKELLNKCCIFLFRFNMVSWSTWCSVGHDQKVGRGLSMFNMDTVKKKNPK